MAFQMTSSLLSSNEFGSISQQSVNTNIDIVTIEHDLFTASLSLYGGHVLSWQPKGQDDVFWMSKNAEFKEGKAIRGGIPICWPWFGPKFDDNGNNAGNHGFARNRAWSLSNTEITNKGVKLVLSYSSENEHPLWSEKFIVEQTLFISETFSQVMKMTNLSDHAVKYTSALHTYFSVSHPENAEVSKLNSCLFDDKITEKVGQVDHIENCVGPLDRVYYNNENQQIIDTGSNRVIDITATNCNQWVLWNPGAEIASNMADVHPKGEDEYVCLEASNTVEQLIEAGQSVSVGQLISVSTR